MIDIIVEYPFMLFKRKAIGRAPSSWAELTEKQFIAISRIIHGSDPDYKFLSILTGINKDLLRKLSSYELLKLSESIDFIGKAGSFYSNFIIGELPWSAKRCIAPKPKMEGITFAQFIFLDAYYNDWIAFQQETALNKFVTSLYLHNNEKFSSEIIESRLELIERIDIDIRKAIAFNYSLIIIWLQKAYPLIFRESEESENTPTQEKTPTKSVWLSIYESIVGDDLINRDKYAELPLHTVLRHMTKKYKENARK
ncbi:MAG: hypothetical protein WCK18_20250 [Prolixibacteraceae bacterium]